MRLIGVERRGRPPTKAGLLVSIRTKFVRSDDISIGQQRLLRVAERQTSKAPASRRSGSYSAAGIEVATPQEIHFAR